MNKAILIIGMAAILSSCNPDKKNVEAGHGDHDHGNELTMSYTLFQGDYELFVEFGPLLKGNTTSFAAHFTRLSEYRPLTEGKVSVSLIKGKKGIRNSVVKPASPGIFRPAIKPAESGEHILLLELITALDTSLFNLGAVMVYDDLSQVEEPAGGDNPEEITFLKEQAWKAEFSTIEIRRSPHHTVIETAARVKSPSTERRIIPATSAGIFTLMVLEGEDVKPGKLLGSIQSAGIEYNMGSKLEESRIAMEKSRSDYLRVQSLFGSGAISQKEYGSIKSRYLTDSVNYQRLSSVIRNGASSVLSPAGGIVSRVIAQGGSMVKEGDALLEVSTLSQYVIEAYLPSSKANMLRLISDAHFRLPGDDAVTRLAELNGSILTRQALPVEGATRIPFRFLVDATESLHPGMTLEAYLLAEAGAEAIVVPVSSIIEEQGKYYVFVQTGGESYVKREVKCSNWDGRYVEISEGLSVSERIVSKGAMLIKLASASGELPLHGHTH